MGVVKRACDLCRRPIQRPSHLSIVEVRQDLAVTQRIVAHQWCMDQLQARWQRADPGLEVECTRVESEADFRAWIRGVA
jgi:hypothetical protein